MTVKGCTINAGFPRNIRYGDIINVFFLNQFQESRCNIFFRLLSVQIWPSWTSIPSHSFSSNRDSQNVTVSPFILQQEAWIFCRKRECTYCIVYLFTGNLNSQITLFVVACSTSSEERPFNSAIFLMTAGRISEVFLARRRSLGWITSLQ